MTLQARSLRAELAKVPYGFLEILELDPEFDDNCGASRLDILFHGADGIATYEALSLKIIASSWGLPCFFRTMDLALTTINSVRNK